jgi:asparagine synthase (glutamine-hydrolysing)
MCGIAGSLDLSSKHLHAPLVSAMLDRMRYRGPDHLGLFSSEEIAIGNVRLAIQGIDKSGNQPIFNEDESIVTVFNGEIYNHHELRESLLRRGHKFRSQTDTELLVHLYEDYGKDAANQLNGMFSFAIYDRTKKRLLLSRDRIGQKPLFIYRKGERLFFSSEIKALLIAIDSPQIQRDSLYEYLQLGYVLEPNTILENVRALQPGSVEIFEPNSHSVYDFWQPATSSQSIEKPQEWLEEAKPIFNSAIKRHLISDVPITLLLSGGIDSSLILALTSQHSMVSEVYTGSFLDDETHDEFQFANSLSQVFGKRCNRINLSTRQLSETLPEYLRCLPQPSGDYSGLASFLLCREVAKRYRVALGGDGGDELFGGYPTYKLPDIQRRFWFLPRFTLSTGWYLSNLFSNKDTYLSLPFKLQQIRQAWGQSDATAHYKIKSFLPSEAESLINHEFRTTNERGLKTFNDLFNNSRSTAIADRLAYIDLRTFLLSGTIPKIERMSMQSSLEVRLPLLDNEIIDLSHRTPWHLRYRNNIQKYVLKELLSDICKANKIEQKLQTNPRKQGFSPPLRKMLKTHLITWRNETLREGCHLFSEDLLDLINQLQSQGWDTHRLEWNICTLCSWIKENKIVG